MTTPAAMSLRAYAASRRARGLTGTSLKAVQEAVAVERIRVNLDGTIDRDAADAAWRANTDTSRIPHTNGHGAPSTLAQSKTLESIERTRQLRMQNDVRSGQLVERRTMERQWAAMIVVVRDQLLGVPAGLRMTRPTLSREDLAAVDQAIRRTLDELPDKITAAVEDEHVGAYGDRAPDPEGLAPASANGARPARGRGSRARPADPSADTARRGADPDGDGARPRDAGRDGSGSRPARVGASDVGRAASGHAATTRTLPRM